MFLSKLLRIRQGILLKIVCMGISLMCCTYFLYNMEEVSKNFYQNHTASNAELKFAKTAPETNGFAKIKDWIFHTKRTIQVLGTEKLRNIIVFKEEDCPKRQFLVYKCSKGLCGGWGDREKGIVSTFLLALLTNRTFAIIMNKPCDIENFMQPLTYDWTICKQYLETLPNANVTEENHVTGDRGFLTQIQNIDFDKKWTKQAIVLYMNGYEPVMNGIKKHKDVGKQMKWMLNKTNPEIVQLVLRTLLKPRPRLLDHLNDFISNITKGRKLVCSHIRKGKNPSIPGDNNLPKGPPREETLFSFLKQYNNIKKYIIYIATDSDDVRKSATSKFRNVVNINRTIVHVDRLGKGTTSTEACEGLYTVLFEQQMLSSCDSLILTRSNFGTISAYLRGSTEDLYVYQTETDIVMPSNLTNIQSVYKFV